MAVGIICIALVGLLVWKYIYQLSRPNQNLSYNIENKDTSNQKSIQNSTTKATPIIQEQSSNQNEKSKVVAENAEKVNYTKLKKTPQVEKNSIKYQKVDGNQLEQDRLTAEAIEKSNRIKAAQKQLKNAQSYCEGGLTAKAISALSAVNISDLPKSLQKKIVDAKAFLEGGFEDKAARIIAEAIKEL